MPVSLPAGITLLGKGHGLSAGISGPGRGMGTRKGGRGCLQHLHTRHAHRALCTNLWTEGTPDEGASYSADMGPPRPTIWGQPPGPWLGRYRGKEAGLGQHGLLKPAHGRKRPLAQVAELQPSQAPEKPEAQPWFGGILPRQCHSMLGDHAVTVAGAPPPPPVLNVSGFKDQGGELGMRMPVCL